MSVKRGLIVLVFSWIQLKVKKQIPDRECVLENLPVLPVVQSSQHERKNKDSSAKIDSTESLKTCSNDYVKPGVIPLI